MKISDKQLNSNEKEFILHNIGYLELNIYTLESTGFKPLCRIPPSNTIYLYSNELIGKTLYSSLSRNLDIKNNAVYPPITTSNDIHNIFFGVIYSSFLRTDAITSDRNEILSLQIENRSLKPYHIFYNGEFLCKLEPYHLLLPSSDIYYPSKYVVLTNNHSRHFQLGTWLEFRMEAEPNKFMKSQFVQLKDKFTTNIYVGDTNITNC
jgi:hypothetical protein